MPVSLSPCSQFSEKQTIFKIIPLVNTWWEEWLSLDNNNVQFIDRPQPEEEATIAHLEKATSTHLNDCFAAWNDKSYLWYYNKKMKLQRRNNHSVLSSLFFLKPLSLSEMIESNSVYFKFGHKVSSKVKPLWLIIS